MSGLAFGVIVFGALGMAGLLLATMLGVRSLAELLLAAYVVGFALGVGLALLTSLVDGELSRSSLAVGALASLASAGGVRLLAGGAGVPRVASGTWPSMRSSRPLGALALVIALALVYVVALILGTAPNGWDQLNYHLARAAFWAQEGIGYIDSAYDDRLNIYPPHGEIPFALALGATGKENAAALAQFGAALVCAVGVAALARRLGVSAAEAGFGALLFLALPIVLLQSSTTKNDLVVASLLVCAAVFALGETRAHVCLSGLAVALAMGAKFTAGYGVVVLVLLALVAEPRTLRTWRIGALTVGALSGSYWYAVNALEGGGLLGERQGIPGLTAILSPPENILAAFGLAVDWLDVSGAVGRDILLYGLAAIAVALALTGRRSGSLHWEAALVAGALVASPLLIWAVSTEVGRPALLALSDALGTPQAFLAEDAPAAAPTSASDTGSWFGPVGLLFVAGTAVTGGVLVRRNVLPRTALVFAISPLIWLVLVALTLTYHPWQGRFFLFPVALSASLWGLVLRKGPLAWGAVALSATTVVLALVHYEEKPSGVRLLERAEIPSVWSMERAQVQSLHDPTLAPVFEFVDEHVPAEDAIALALGTNDFGYPAFGPRMRRAVTLVPFGSDAVAVRGEWIYSSPERAQEIDRTCWEPAFESDAGVVFRRTAACRP